METSLQTNSDRNQKHKTNYFSQRLKRNYKIIDAYATVGAAASAAVPVVTVVFYSSMTSNSSRSTAEEAALAKKTASYVLSKSRVVGT